MPIYEYRCQRCRNKSSQFLRSFSHKENHYCPHCGCKDVTRLISRVAKIRVDDSLDWIPSAETLGDVDESDPKSIARSMKKWRKDMGATLGSEAQDAVSMMDAGFTPGNLAEIERED